AHLLAHRQTAFRKPREACQGRLTLRLAPTPLQARLLLQQVRRFASGEDDEQLPKVVPVEQLREEALFGPAAKAGERAQGDIFFIRNTQRPAFELAAGQAHEPAEVAFPEF